MSVLVVGLWLVMLAVAGRAVLGLAGGDGGDLALGPVAGLVLLHFLLVLVDLSPLSWSRLSVVVPYLALAAFATFATLATSGGKNSVRRLRGRPLQARVASDFEPGWGDAVATLCVLLLGTLALLRRIAASDFIYHWGLKGKKFTLAGGIDTTFLGAPWNGYLHPDYPNLVPELFAVTAVTEGRFREATVLLWSVVATLLLLLAARRLLSRLVADRRDLQAALALIALGTTSFSISWQMSGNADAWLALAVLLAAGSLATAQDPLTDLGVGTVAAFAAAVKIEGVVLAGLVVLLHLGRRLSLGEITIAALVRMTLPPALVALPWAVAVRSQSLAQGYTSLELDAGRLLELPPIVLDSLLHDGWHGLSLFALGVVLCLPFFRRFRLAALLLLAQLVFYVVVYLTTTGDMEMLVRTTAPRLVFHLLPAALVLGTVLLTSGSGDEAQIERACEGKNRG